MKLILLVCPFLSGFFSWVFSLQGFFRSSLLSPPPPPFSNLPILLSFFQSPLGQVRTSKLWTNVWIITFLSSPVTSISVRFCVQFLILPEHGHHPLARPIWKFLAGFHSLCSLLMAPPASIQWEEPAPFLFVLSKSDSFIKFLLSCSLLKR